jgi:tRNA modification GTPase
LLEQAAGALRRAAAIESPDLAAENLRVAIQALGRVTGRVDLDELLDVVFRDFCIGK